VALLPNPPNPSNATLARANARIAMWITDCLQSRMFQRANWESR
jgi:hypothetical protein